MGALCKSEASLFLCSLFNDIVSDSDYTGIALNGQDFGRKQLWPDLQSHLQIFLDG
jgi:hypothetical protein